MQIWNIPFAHNPFFTGRENLLEKLHTQLQTTKAAAVSQPQAISGLGGIGKTQLAIEYAYSYRQEYQVVLWAKADTTEALNASYTEIAGLLQLPQHDAQEQEVIVQAVKHWLRTNGGWLLILDNADELDLVQPFVPTECPGHLLLTTRAQWMGELAQPLEVETMETEAGALLILRRARLVAPDAPLDVTPPEERRQAAKLAEELGGLPLALDQAGAYIEETRCGLADYLQLYQTGQARLLARRGGKKPSHPDSVATTWAISFAKVEEANPMAAELLRACAFLAPDAIPEELLVEVLKTPLSLPERQRGLGSWFSWFPSEQRRKLRLALSPAKERQMDEAIAFLRIYSLIQRNRAEKTLSVHRLVQAVVRDSLPTEIQHQWMQRAIHAVASADPGADVANWPALERLLPHALVCATWIEHAPLIMPAAANLLNWTAYYLHERARHGEAESLYQRALAMREQQLGATHPKTATSLNNLAELYKTQGRYEEAEPLLKRALAIREQQLGAIHPDTAASLGNLAGLYLDQGRYEEAEPLLKNTLSICEQQLGAMHPDTATSLHELARLYQTQRKYGEAESLYQRAIFIYEQHLGATHPNTATSLGSLAEIYYLQGKYREAELLYQRSLAMREQHLGATHPNMAPSLNDLALLYKTQRKYAEAELLYQRTLAICEQHLGVTHPKTAICLGNIAELYQAQGRYEEAELLLKRTLSFREQQLRAAHPDTATSLNHLAALYYEQGKYTEAEPLFERALAICEQGLGASHPDTVTSLNNLAGLYRAQGKYTEAEPLLRRSLSITEQTLGGDHPDMVTNLSNLAGLYRAQRKYTEAEPLLQRILAISEQELGTNHLDTAESLNNLAEIYRVQRKYTEAEPLYKRALAIWEQELGATHPNTAISLNNLALLYHAQGKYEEAKPLYKRALATWEREMGAEHPTSQIIRRNYTSLRGDEVERRGEKAEDE